LDEFSSKTVSDAYHRLISGKLIQIRAFSRKNIKGITGMKQTDFWKYMDEFSRNRSVSLPGKIKFQKKG